MIEVTASGHVPAAPEWVWELICDTSRLPEWVAATDAVTRADGPAGPGVTYDEVNPVIGPWKARSRWRVTEFDPPRRQVHHGEGLPLTRDFAVVMQVAPDGGGSRVTLTLQATPGAGPLGALFFRLMRPQVDRDNRRSLDNLSELAGREAGGPPAAG